MPGPPVCERHLFHDGDHLWLIVDRVKSPEPYEVTVSYLFASDTAQMIGPGIVLAGDLASPNVAVLHESREGLSIGIEPAILSRVYGQQEPAKRLRLKERGSDVQIVTAIVGLRGPGLPFLSLGVEGRDPAEIRLETSRGVTTIRLEGDDTWSVEQVEKWPCVKIGN
jgi:hypothetical protein